MADNNNGYNIAQAYIEIMPSTQKFGSAIKGDMSSEGEKAGTQFSDAFKKGLKTMAIAAGAAATAVAGVVSESVKGFAEYEQLVGGVEKLFGDIDYQSVVDNASRAFETAGLSANEYMETVTSFSASLISSLSGDTQQAVEYADTAITDMSDNANVFGTSIQDIQHAYQGFAKQNYTMLDNLKLGYGGTKTEMERLVQDAEDLDSAFQATRDANGDLTLSFADVVEAIHIVQDNMNIAGTTAKEANQTVEGSAKSMQASWKNLVTGMGNSNANISVLVSDFSDSFKTMVDNTLPVVETAITSMSTVFPELVSDLLPDIISTITSVLPNLIDATSGLINGLIDALPNIVSGIVDALPGLLENVIGNVGSILGNLLPALAESAVDVLANLPATMAGMAGGIIEGMSGLVTGIIDSVAKQAEDSIPEDIADGYVGKIQSNFEKTFSDGFTNLKGTIAGLIGDEDWAEAVANIKLASALEGKIISDYESAQTEMAKYSFENFTIETEASINAAMTLMGALEGMIDEDGTITGNIGVAQSYVDKINSILGEGAVSIDKTPADWIIQIAEKYTNESGQIINPSGLKEEIKAELNKLLGGDENGAAIDLAEQTYNVVSKVLSNYNLTTATADQERIKGQICSALVAAGVPEVEAEVIANASVTEGALNVWYGGPGRSTGWDNSNFIAWMQEQGYLPTTEEPAEAEAIAEIATQFLMGETDMEQFSAALEELDLTDEEKNRVIAYTLDTAAFEQAKEEFEALKQKQYEAQLTSIFVEANIENVQHYTEAVKAAREAQAGFGESVSADEMAAFNSLVNDAQLALNAEESEARTMYGTMWDLSSALQEAGDRESYIQQMLSNDTAYKGRQKEVDALRDTESKLVQEMILQAGGIENLQGANEDLVNSILATTVSVEDAADMIGLNAAQTEILKGGLSNLSGYYDDVQDGMANTTAEALYWLTANEDADALMQNLGISAETLASLLVALAGNEEYLSGTTEATSETIAESSGAIDGYGTAVDQMSDMVSEEAGEIETAGDDVKEATVGVISDSLSEAELAAMESSKVGTVLASELKGSMLAGKPGVVATTDGIAEDMLGSFDDLPDDMNDAGSDTGENLDSGFSSWDETIELTTEKVYKHFKHFFYDVLPGMMYTWGASAGTKIKEGFGAQSEVINSTVTNIATGIKNAFEISNELKGKGANAGAGFNSGLLLNNTIIATTAKTLASSAATPLAALYSAMYSYGYNAGAGFNNGLLATSTAIYNSAQTIAANVSSIVAKSLKIQSPSRVMREMGEYTAEGLALGMADGTGMVIESAVKMAQGAVSTAEGMFKGIDRAAAGAVYSEETELATAIRNSGADYTRSMEQGQMTQEDLSGYMSEILFLLDRLSRMQMVVNRDALVGELAPAMNEEFESIRLMEGRS